MNSDTRHHVHALVDQLPPVQLPPWKRTCSPCFFGLIFLRTHFRRAARSRQDSIGSCSSTHRPPSLVRANNARPREHQNRRVPAGNSHDSSVKYFATSFVYADGLAASGGDDVGKPFRKLRFAMIDYTVESLLSGLAIKCQKAGRRAPGEDRCNHWYDGEAVNSENINELNRAELEWLCSQLEAGKAFICRFAHSEPQDFSLAALDNAYSNWLAGAFDNPEEINSVINMVGVVFGQVLADSLALKWALVTDQNSSELAILGLPSMGSPLIYPINFVAKRWERGEEVFFENAARCLERDIVELGLRFPTA